MESFREHVLQEAAHELVAAQSRRAPSVRSAMLVAEGDAILVEANDAADMSGNSSAAWVSKRMKHAIASASVGGRCFCSMREMTSGLSHPKR